MSLGISNVEIKRFINKENDYLKRNFVGVFPSNFINYFISSNKLMKERNSTYHLTIMNIDRFDKSNTMVEIFRSSSTRKNCLH